jgi:predicted metal-dependent phosphoesterase TrpH
MAKEKGLRAISISDHDTVAAYPEAIEWSRRFGVEIIPSVELTTLFEGREFHLLLPFVDWESPALKRILAKVTAARMEEAKERVAKLQGLGFDIEGTR